MHIKRCLTILTLLVVGTLTVPTAHAQTTLTVNVPFEFVAGGKYMPPGQYVIKARANRDALQIFDERGHSIFLLGTTNTDNRLLEESRLVFHRYGEVSFLSGIYWQGYREGREFRKSRYEQELARNVGPPSPAVVAAR